MVIRIYDPLNKLNTHNFVYCVVSRLLQKQNKEIVDDNEKVLLMERDRMKELALK